MMKNLAVNSRFMGSSESHEKASTIIVGVPLDFTTSYRPGARFGPQKIRETSYGLEEYSPYLDKDLAQASFFDAGDLDIVYGDVQKSHESIEEAAKEIFQKDCKPLFIGGDHSITFPIVKQAYDKYGEDLILVHFDAHADLRDDYMGFTHSHASVIKRCCKLIGSMKVFQFGIRSGTREEFDWAKINTNFYPFEVFSSLKLALPKLKDKKIYLTIDIDVLDPAFACGTGTPEPGGCSSSEFLQAIHLMQELTVVGMDVVEVSPVYDQSDRTPIIAAKIIREALLSFLA